MGDFGEPRLDLIKPEAAGGDEVNVKAGMSLQPAAHGRCMLQSHVRAHAVISGDAEEEQ